MRPLIDELVLALARLGPAGLSPKAPGTMGSALAAAAAPWLFLPLGLPARLGLLALLFLIGAWAAGRAERLLGRKDPSCVVVDELVGQWIALLPVFGGPAPGPAAGPAAAPWVLVLAAFALFRLFDIWKPGPVRASERWLPAGGGVMIDDVLAGLFAMVVMIGLIAVLGAL